MNMLTNKVPFGLLSEEEKELFRNSINSCECYTEAGTWNNWNSAGALIQDVVLRLKLKEGGWYKINTNLAQWRYDRQSFFDKYNNKFCSLKEAKTYNMFQATTKAEIDSVKPTFKRGDCFTVPSNHRIYRLGGSCYHGGNSDLTIIFDKVAGMSYELKVEDVNTYNYKHATPEQIEQLEREEMKAGKKWNGEGYEDWFTADGLTWNELIEHDVSEIEYKGTEWKGTIHDSDDFKRSVGLDEIHNYRLKPKESFVDKEVIRESDVQILLQSEEITEFALNFLRDLRR